MFFVFMLCIVLYFVKIITRFIKNENEWNPVPDSMIFSHFPDQVSTSGALVALSSHYCDFASFDSDEIVETPFLKVSPGRRYVYPFDWLDPTVDR